MTARSMTIVSAVLELHEHLSPDQRRAIRVLVALSQRHRFVASELLSLSDAELVELRPEIAAERERRQARRLEAKATALPYPNTPEARS